MTDNKCVSQPTQIGECGCDSQLKLGLHPWRSCNVWSHIYVPAKLRTWKSKNNKAEITNKQVQLKWSKSENIIGIIMEFAEAAIMTQLQSIQNWTM